MKMWTVLVTRDVTSTQTCQLFIEAETEDEATNKACDLATAEHQGAVAWEDDEESFHYGEDGVYITLIEPEQACKCYTGEWSGSCNPENPDNEWLCDDCGRVIPA